MGAAFINKLRQLPFEKQQGLLARALHTHEVRHGLFRSSPVRCGQNTELYKVFRIPALPCGET